MSNVTLSPIVVSKLLSPPACRETEAPTLPIDRIASTPRLRTAQPSLGLPAPTAPGATLRPRSLDALRAQERAARGPVKDTVLAHMNIVAGALDGALGIPAGAMFGYEAEYANARTAARIESAIVSVASGVGMARTGGAGLALPRGGALAATRPAAVVPGLAGATVATSGIAKLTQPLESRSYVADPLGELQVTVDQTGKAHKQLPARAQLASLPSDELRALKTELEASVAQRIVKNVEHGSDAGHAARQANEQSIIKLIEKILSDRRQ